MDIGVEAGIEFCWSWDSAVVCLGKPVVPKGRGLLLGLNAIATARGVSRQ